MAEAGYGAGFQVTLNCPNDRYVNDEGICQAVVGMMGQISIKVNLVSQSKTLHFPLVQKNPPETEFYMVGWGVQTFDSEYIFSFMHHTRDAKFGSWNALRYSNADLDRKIEALSGGGRSREAQRLHRRDLEVPAGRGALPARASTRCWPTR